MTTLEFTTKTKALIDGLKRVCADYGLGNDGNEFKIITQVFLYKFLNDKFAHQVKIVDSKLAKAESWEKMVGTYSAKEYDMLLLKLGPKTAKLNREHFLSYLASKQNSEEFAKLFDDTLRDIAIKNNEIFSVKTSSGVKVRLFDELSQYIHDPSKRDDFCRALVNQLVDFSFEQTFSQKFDFFSTIFEYLIKDYNKDGGGKYAEYYTPHAVAKIMASVLVNEKVSNVTVYDPSAGSGTLLMNLAHAIGEDRCTIYSQDISQKSSSLLRLNLILNDLVHSIQNVVVDNTILTPAHKVDNKLRAFDYIVSNPPFKLDFSDFRDKLDTPANKERLFAGIPKITPKSPEKMAIYLLFIQHIMFSLSKDGKAAIVVPTGFLTAQKGIEFNIRERMVKEKMLRGVVSMPSNIFATTGTNVSIIFLDKTNKKGEVVLMDASKLGETIKDGKNQKTLLSPDDERLIIDTFNERKTVADFSVAVSYDEIEQKNCSFSAGQYFGIKIEHVDVSSEEFFEKMKNFEKNLKGYFSESKKLEDDIFDNFKGLNYE